MLDAAIPLEERIPDLSPALEPPRVVGTAAIAAAAFAGAGFAELMQRVDRPIQTLDDAAAQALDLAAVHELSFRPAPAQALQDQALQLRRVYRVGGSDGTLRVLALMAPGNLMVNTPLDFITTHLDVRLDLLFLHPGHPLPAEIPDHDVAFFAVSDSDPATLHRLMPLFARWPRPCLNDPARVIGWSRDRLARDFAGAPGICSPPARRVTRGELAGLGGTAATLLPGCDYPVLIRPVDSHAGADLAKADGPEDLAAYLLASREQAFFVTAFVDYRGADGRFRKYRIVFFDGAPYLCHMAVSEHWMVHYLNAGMTGSAAKRAEEAQAMADFDGGFARRHAAAFALLHARLGLDCFSIDCAETADGRLLLFETDVAAIIHMMDPPDLFGYKIPQMRRVFAAFEDLLRARAATAGHRRDRVPCLTG